MDVKIVNYRNNEYPIPEGMTVETLLSAMNVNQNNITFEVEGETLYILEKTGTKGNDYPIGFLLEFDEEEEKDEEEEEKDEEEHSDDLEETLKNICFPNRKRVVFENGKLKEVVSKKAPKSSPYDHLADLLNVTPERAYAIIEEIKKLTW